MIYYILHNDDGEVTARQARTLPLTEGMEAYAAQKIEVDEEQYQRSTGEFCFVDTEALTLVFPVAQPSSDHTFDYVTKQWTVLLADQKATKWSEIKAARDLEEFGTFTWSTHTFQCDEVSQRRIQGAVQLAQLDATTTLDWTLADNTVQTFNATELQQIGQALAAHVNACHVKSRTKRGEIDAANTEAELDAITW